MKKNTALRICGVLSASWVLAVIVAMPLFSAGAPPAELTVSAAISLSKSLQTLRSLYGRQAPGVSITLNLGASGILEQQIEQGAPADIFVSASPQEMNALQSRGLLLEGSRKDLLRNVLVLISPAASNDVSGFRDLVKPHVRRVAMANPESVPAGVYARQALEYFKIYRRIEPKIIFAQDVRQALAYVESGDVDAGIVYLTEARLSSKVKVVATAPRASHDPIVYPVAILKRCRNIPAARQLVNFFMSPQARSVFEQEGFSVGNRE